MIRKLRHILFEPVDIAPLVFFRVAFGAVMLWEVWRYFEHTRVERYYIEPTFFFPYFGFDWLHPLPGDGMIWLFYGLGLLSLAILLGIFYRVSMVMFWLGFTYVFLLDKAQYLNHFYLVSLISFLMIFIPAHRAASVDARWRPAIRASSAPTWSLWLLRGQMGIVYFYGGIAKINPDWLAGQPLRKWLAERTDFPFIGQWFTEEWMVYLFSYGGLLFDLFIVPLILWRRTRIPALVLALFFHLSNARLFNIGIFPWFAIAITLLYLPPHWFRWWGRTSSDATQSPAYTSHRRWILAGIAFYGAVQVLLPLRHWLYPGDPSWTEEGHLYSWHMRLREKDGYINFFANDPANGTIWPITGEAYLTARQFNEMTDNPQMILHFAHHLADQHQADHGDIGVHVWAMISLNSRAPQLLLDPTADLTAQSDTLLPANWILPLVQRPYPHEPVPALLISRRQHDSLLLINITHRTFPLYRLSLETGDLLLAEKAFGADELLPGECLLAHTESADLMAIVAPCNEAGARISIPSEWLTEPLMVRTGSGASVCSGPACVVVDEGGD
ncbi:MAG: HTTM domain-containing protein [Anaerolineae bacterium]|nr:HTTM domain-containing protein [Anaerolineae bacterium]